MSYWSSDVCSSDLDYITADNFSKEAKTGTATDEEGIPDGMFSNY